MTLRERLATLRVLQRSVRFKMIATACVVIVAVVAYASWWTVLHAPADAAPPPDASAQTSAPADTATPGSGDDGSVVASPSETDTIQPRIDPGDVLSAIGSRDASLGVAFGVAGGVAVACLVIWLGAGLTYLAIALATAVVVVPLRLYGPTAQLGSIAGGVAVLAASFTICIETVRTLLSGNHPVFAVGRTVVAEAVRMKISFVFILLLIGWLAALPWLLDDAQPLRFRVQTFLRNGTAGSFWALALLTMFFAVATVSFEQRDKTIWQTVVKPVRAWHYILGKWIGLMAVNAALLGVTASGVFLFTEYLRSQPAKGEVAPYVNADGSGRPTEDRLILEARVLTARDGRAPTLPEIAPQRVAEEIEKAVDEAVRTAGPEAERQRRQLRTALLPSTLEKLAASRTAIAPFDNKDFEFRDLARARDLGKPITLRYKVQAGANDPTQLAAMLFEFRDQRTDDIVRLSIDTPLNVTQSLDLRPEVIGPDGRLLLTIYNGDPTRMKPNNFTIRFPPDGLEVLYVRGGYEANFLRVMTALWIKLGFIAAAGIFGATFLSFPVACLLAFLVLFAAETSGFLKGALEIYTSVDQAGQLDVFRLLVRAVAIPITKIFAGYRELDSTGRLVDGRLLSWSAFTGAGTLILALTGAVLASAVAVFRKRELAVYSGT